MGFGLPHHIHSRMQRYPSNRCVPEINSTATTRVLASRESGSILTNFGASGEVTFKLPTSVYPGINFLAIVSAAQLLTLDPGDDTHLIVVNGTTTTAGQEIKANDEGESCFIYWSGAAKRWIATVTGTWTVA